MEDVRYISDTIHLQRLLKGELFVETKQVILCGGLTETLKW